MAHRYNSGHFTGGGPPIGQNDVNAPFKFALAAGYVAQREIVQHISGAGQSEIHEQPFPSSSPRQHPSSTQPQPYAPTMHFATTIPPSSCSPLSPQHFMNLGSGAPEKTTTPPYEEADNYFGGSAMPGSNGDFAFESLTSP
ncbi:hypothetical protein BCR34DRAFT_637608 [Clohesyomyces aquaticus]|uniref:Uncharacterized protein n=1 Tax=Clohesyomyces aquaticus TaxID=1231657 RepID=A0A1Y1YSN9_9PLEO|nr:hypothetical protein BCR34DRAFT_637608 [Clohesyomyces aquaticus]